ncbi:9742_t:CDS:2 [Rhizophagus irregularis]|nr:9742_t:CDS:2 [Rhizophagus irregularis]
MAPTKLKIKGNKAFSLLSIETDEDLSKTWRLMTKVKDSLEYGMRLENLSWRLWFMHHLMVHGNKSISQTQFKKLSTATTKKLENEKATNLKHLAAPLYRPPKAQEILEKKGKKKYAKKPSISAVANVGSQVKKTNQKTKHIKTASESLDSLEDNHMSLNIGVDDIFRYNEANQEFYLRQYTNDQDPYQVVSLPGIFTRSFDAHAILDPNNQQPTMMVEFNDVMRVHPHHHFYSSSDSSEPPSPTDWYPSQNSELQSSIPYPMNVGHDAVYVSNSDHSPSHINVGPMSLNTSHDTPINTPLNTPLNTPTTAEHPHGSLSNILYMNQYPEQNNTNNASISLGQQQQQPQQGSAKSVSSSTSPNSTTSSMDVPSAARPSANNSTGSSTSENSRPKKAHSNGEQQCFNCGVTSTPLWRRSANDELLCNACGLYLKLHKMARPKTMKPHIVRKDARDDEAAQPVCSNCGTMTTPFFKLHHERRPLSMKTDVIKKRQRYENGQAPNRRGGKKQRSQDINQQEAQPQPPPQSQQAQVVYEPNGSMAVPSTTIPSIGSISVGQSSPPDYDDESNSIIPMHDPLVFSSDSSVGSFIFVYL